jgi:thioredoxin-related protein
MMCGIGEETSMKASRITLMALGIALVAGYAHAKSPQAMTDLNEALANAKADSKLLFIQYGREACGNCQALKSYIAGGSVRLAKDRFIYVDLNCDDPDTRKAFAENFKVQGNMLPFVVIADPEGKQLVSRSGYGNPEDFEKMIREAKKTVPKQAPAKPTTTPPKPSPAKSTVATAATPIPRDESRETRTWKSRTGEEVKASLLEESGGYLVLKKEDGAKVRIQPNLLSDGDQEYLRGMKQPPPSQPVTGGTAPADGAAPNPN